MKKLIYLSILFFSYIANSAVGESDQNTEALMRTYNISKVRFLSASINERKVLSTLYEINSEMKDMTRKRERLTGKFLNVQGNVKKLAKDIATLEQAVEQQRKVLSHRLRFIYKMGESGSLPLLFSATSAHDLELLIKYIKAYADRDYIVIGDYEANLNKLLDKRDSLKKEVTKLVGLKQKIKSQENQLEKQQLSKSVILKKIKSDKKAELSRLAKIRKKSDIFGSALLDDSFFEKKGTLPWPTKGRVIQGYGLFQERENSVRLRHKGLFISSEKGAKIQSVHGGVVSFVGHVPGHGGTVIVGHGDHYFTVYSQLEGSKVKVGDEILAGQPLGQLGSSSALFGFGLYFEIRHFSEAVDPEQWLKNFET